MKRLSRRSRPSAAPAEAADRPDAWADPLAALRVENLHRITPTLYRSAQPRRDDVPALQALGIRTVLSFRSFNSDQRPFRHYPQIALQRVPIDTWAIDDAKVLGALLAIRRAERDGPVLIHCWHGADRTGVVAAAYRMALQDWRKEDALAEMFRGGYGYHTVWRNIPRYLARLEPAALRAALADLEAERDAGF